MKKINEGDDKSVISLVDVVERGYANLSRLSIEKEMSNTITLSLIEEKLPSNVKREWSKLVNKEDREVDKLDKFPYFLKFLIEQKRILEYEWADLRKSDDNQESPIYYK